MKNINSTELSSKKIVEKTKKILHDYMSELQISMLYWNVSTQNTKKRVNYFEYYSMYHHSPVMRSINFYKPIITIINYE